MRRHLSIAAMLVLVVAMVGGGVATAADSDQGHKTRMLTLYSRETSFTYVTATGEVFTDGTEPSEEVPPGPGDRLLVVDTLYSDPDRTEEVGRNLIECTFVSATGETPEELVADALCHGVVTLHDQGDIAWQAQFRAPEAFEADPFVTVALTGGTGKFERAGGSAEIFDESPEDGEESLSRYEIRLLKFKVQHRRP